MARDAGTLVDLEQRTVRGRGGRAYPLDRVEQFEGGVYLSRAVTERPHFDYLESWLLPEQGWAINQYSLQGRVMAPSWYIETQLFEVDGPRWAIKDGYVDFFLFEGERYEILDMNELVEGIEQGDIAIDEAMRVLNSVHALAEALRSTNFSGLALLEAHGLPAPRVGTMLPGSLPR